MVLSDRIHTLGSPAATPWRAGAQDRARRRLHLPQPRRQQGHRRLHLLQQQIVRPNGRTPPTLQAQFDAGRRAIATAHPRAAKFIAYFQAYTNTYAKVEQLRALYDEALAEPDVIGLSIGTRPDCVPPPVLDLLAEYRERGHEVWLELGLQSAFDDTLARVNRGHGFAEYDATATAARERGIPVCCHLIVGLPGEDESHSHASLDRVLEIGVDGLKLHPLHVVKHTMLASEWKRGEYTPLSQEDYMRIAADLIERTPEDVVYHRVTGTASPTSCWRPTGARRNGTC